jgi:long-chain acyl-CoA synthetase
LFNVTSDAPALIDGESGRIYTHQDLQRAALQFPLKKRSLLFLFSRNRLEDALTYICAINCGHVVCLLDEEIAIPFKQHLVESYQPDYIYSEQTSLKDYKDYQECAKGIYQAKRKGPTLHPDLQLLLSSSGTTGSPKLIRLSRENLLANSRSIINYLAIDTGERAIASLPFHYSYGLSVLHSHLLAGASVVLTQSSVAQKSFWEIFKNNRCTSLAGVPYTYKVMDRVGFLSMELPSLRTLTQAGGRLEPSLVAKFHQKVQRFFVMYGQTEATARIAFLPPEYLPKKAGAIGIAIPGGTLKVFDDQNQMNEPNSEGELVYEGANVMLGYATQASDLEKGDELHGTLRTGDLGYFDQDQLFYVTGRLKRISKVYGLRINLDDVERTLSSYGTVAATTTDEKISIYIEQGTAEDCKSCLDYLVSLYHLHPSTFLCQPIDQLPRTSSGKIEYKRLT